MIVRDATCAKQTTPQFVCSPCTRFLSISLQRVSLLCSFFFHRVGDRTRKEQKVSDIFSREFDSGFSSFSCRHEFPFRSYGLAKYSLFIHERIESPISIYRASGFATDLAIRSQEYPFHVSLSFFPFLFLLFPSRY